MVTLHEAAWGEKKILEKDCVVVLVSWVTAILLTVLLTN